MRTADLKKVVLKLFGQKEFYGYEVHKVLASEGIELEISRLYRVLNEMQKEELLESSWKKSSLGPKKKMYMLGEKGRSVLKEIFLDAIKTVHSFYGTYLHSLSPRINVFENILHLLINGLKGDEILVFVTIGFTPMHELIIKNIHNRIPRGKIFLTKPSSLLVDIKLDNLLYLDGFYNDIPLKNDYADCMILINLPKKENLKQALKEWHRVLRPDGKLAILMPSILLEEYEDPLTIGEFIEKHEHEIIEKGEHINKTILEREVKNYFKKMEEKKFVHMSIVKVSQPRVDIE